MVLHVTGFEEPLQALEAVTVAPKPIWTLCAPLAKLHSVQEKNHI